MSRKNRSPEENARRAKIRELLQMANIDSMDDIQNLFKGTIAEFMENGLEAELDEDFGYSKYPVCARAGWACFAVLSVVLAALISAFECCLSGAAVGWRIFSFWDLTFNN